MIIREEIIGGQRLILGDCLKVMPLLGRFDAVVTDPPYGVNVGNMRMGAGRKASAFSAFEWDNSAPDISALTEFPAIIWGGNYFGLPASERWLSWDKMQAFSGADFELAWTNLKGPSKVFRMSRIEAYGRIDKQHPTQKPIALMEWCLGFLPKAQTILDPFMGSGTTLVACQRLGRNGTGIELDPEYFDIACKRVDEATRQVDLFIEPPKPQPVQEGFL
jgi:DNA modification methylase